MNFMNLSGIGSRLYQSSLIGMAMGRVWDRVAPSKPRSVNLNHFPSQSRLTGLY